MTDGVEIADVATDLREGGAAVAQLAQNADLFESAIKAFRAHDAEAWANVLTRAQLPPIICHRICEWVCSKECVRLCILLAGPPREPVTVDQIGPFTAVLTRLAEQPKLIEILVKAVEAEDAKAFQKIAAELRAQPHLHLLCHWICFIRCHLICRVLCERAKWNPADLVARLRESAVAVASVARKPDQLKRVIDGAATLNCAMLKGIFGEFQDCRLICFWLCSWRCLVVCLRLTHSFPLAGDFSVAEMRAFAAFSGTLVGDAAGVEAFTTAVMRQDEKAFIELVRKYKAEKFVHQLCHWICYLVCQRLCICVCPPPDLIPIFDHVGDYAVDGDFVDAVDMAHPHLGTTTSGLAFTGTIPLLGLLPASPAADPIEYRFTVQKLVPAAGPVQPLTENEIGNTKIGELEYWEWELFPLPAHWAVRTADVRISNAPLTIHIRQEFGGPLTVQVSTPIAADGWVRVPSNDDLVHGGSGKFTTNQGALASLDTTKLTLEQKDLHPILAGQPVPPGSLSEKPVFTINFEARKVNGHAFLGGNSRPNIALSNTRFAYDRHPDWAGTTVNWANLPTSTLALLLDMEELLGHGCKALTADPALPLHADYTAYHPYLATCHVYIEGPAPLPPDLHPVPDADGQVTSPPGGQPFATGNLQPCAYILWVKATLNLTSGHGAVYGEFEDHIAFCVH